MKIELTPINLLKPYANNPRDNKKAVDKVAESLKTYGWQQPIVTDSDKTIIVGHTRWLAAQKLGMTEVPVHIAANLTPEQIKAYRLADNRLAEEADWDLDILKQEFSDLQGIADFDLSITGFTDNEISKALTFDASNTRMPYDYLPDHSAEKPVSCAGDIWLLDNHRVMCGDATNWQDLKQLLTGKKANLIFTDPPYNVNYTGRRAKRVSIAGDDSSTAEFTEFLCKAFDNCANSLQKNGSLYICFPGSNLLEFQQALQNSGFTIRTQIVWVKNHFVLNWGRYNIQHEPILYCYLKGQTDAWYGDNTQSTVWQVDKPLANPLHPTMKPVALIQRAIINSSKLHDIVLDPFAGSGSTLIACETLKRTAYLLELMPHYVDTIIRRWEEHTKKTAFLIDGRTFAAVKGERHGKAD